MNITGFLKMNTEPDDSDDEAFALACDQAEGAIRSGVHLSLAEYAAMTAELRAAWITAGNRVLRDRDHAEPDPTLRDWVSEEADRITDAIFGRTA